MKPGNHISRPQNMRITGRGLTILMAVLAAITCFSTRMARADAAAAFDLSGPRVEMKVMRAGKTLPIANVPNLQPGDRLWIHPDFPDSQSVHFLVIVAFLRGATNPPPQIAAGIAQTSYTTTTADRNLFWFVVAHAACDSTKTATT